MAENAGKPLQLRKYLGLMAFLHITRLSFGKRFIDDDGVFDKQGEQLKSILDDSTKLGSKRSFLEFIPGYNYFFKAETTELDKQNKRADDFTKIIMADYAKERERTGGSKTHFVDAMVTLQKEYDLHEDTIIGLLWVSESNNNKSFNILSLHDVKLEFIV